MGNATSNRRTKKNLSPLDPYSIKEFNRAFDFTHSYSDPYIPLILIQAHSTEPNGMIDMTKGMHLFHYCKKGCILRTTQLKGNTDRSISMEYACLKKLDIYDLHENKCPNYNFFIDEANKEEGGIYICLENEIRKLFEFKPGHLYSIGRIIQFIEKNVNTGKIHIGVLSCRTTKACSEVIHALPGSHSQQANMINKYKIHKQFNRTMNNNVGKRKNMHQAFALEMNTTRKRKRKGNGNSRNRLSNKNPPNV